MAKIHKTSVGRKQVAAITGLLLSGFLITHLSGNFLLFSTPEAFNAYAEKLASLGPLLWVARIGLLVIALTHVGTVMSLVMENKRARPVPYAFIADAGTPSLGVKTMPITGILLLVYIVAHIFQFTLGDKTGAESLINGQSYGLYGLVYTHFYGSLLNSAFYVIAMIVLGLHVSHGIQSAFQTFGFNHPKYTPRIKLASSLFGLVVGAGFASIPIYIFLCNPMKAVIQ